MPKQLTVSLHLRRVAGRMGASLRSFQIFAICVLTGVVAVLYLNSLGNDFVNWDDPGTILNNKQIRSLEWTNLKDIFTLRKASTYQPIRVLSYAVDYHFWQLNPLGYHITNIVLYILTCIMILFTTRELSQFLRSDKTSQSHWRVGFFAALLFAVHPVHVEAVTWLSGRKEVLLGFFSFSSVYFYLRASGPLSRAKRGTLYGLAFLCFVLATLSKPSAVVLPVIMLVFELCREKANLTRVVKKAVWFAPAAVVSFILALVLMKVMVEAEGIYPYWGGSLLSNFLVASYLFLLNIKLVAWTINYSNIYILMIPFSILGLFLLLNVALIGLAVWMRKRWPLIAFAIFWFYVTLLPFSNLIPISTLLADRYVFIPSFAYCLVLALCFEKLWSVKRKDVSRDFFPFLTTVFLIGLVVGYGYMTVHQNTVWKDSYTLWLDAAAKQEKSSMPMTSLGALFLDGDMDEEALEVLEKAVKANPSDALGHNNLGIAYQRLGDYKKSEHHYLKALSLKPRLYESLFNLGGLYAEKGDFDKSIGVFLDMVAEHPRDARLYFQLGYVYEKAGKVDDAIRSYEKSIDLAPHVITPYESLGRLYLEKLHDQKMAIHFFRKGLQMVPNSRRTRTLEAEIKRLTSDQPAPRGDGPGET